MLAQHLGDRRPLARLATAVLPVGLGAALVLALFGPLFSPATALATRDVASFHLPLHTDFARLAAQGPPVWNPWLNGGQPLLSNPSYGAFYPPGWLVLAVSPAYALNLLVLLHAALAFAGAWVLARRLGCGRGAAAIAAVGYAAGGAFVSLLHAFTLFLSMAWFPWVVAASEAVLRHPASGGRSWWRPAASGAAALGLQVLNGEPVTVLVTGLALVALGATEARRPERALRLAVPVVVAVLLAAVQILPTARRLRDSPRAGALEVESAATWSAPPARLAELVLPRLWGDPARSGEHLYFGWDLHDQHYPYLISIYPGLLIAVLALSALARWPVPRRGAWLAAVAVGVFLGAGRYNPLFGFLHQHLPLLGRVRFPEKFLLLAVAVLPFAAALGWRRLMDARRRGDLKPGDLPLALALAVAASAAGLAAVAHFAPGAAAGFVSAGSGLPLPPAALAAGVRYLTRETLLAMATALAAAGLFALLRWRRPPPAALAALAVLLVGGDLWRCGHGLLTRLPAAEYRQPPAAARALLAGGGERIFSDELTQPQDQLVLRQGEPGLDLVRTKLRRLDPYSGNLWGLGYALNPDYDLMLTAWGRHALSTLREDWSDMSQVALLLGAWNVGGVVARQPTWAMLAELARGEEAAPARLYANPRVLPRHRFVAAVAFHPTVREALAAARAGGYDFAHLDHWVGTGDPGGATAPRPPAELLEVVDRGGRVAVRYRASGGGFFVAASTFDRGWTATVDGRPAATYPTAIGQLGVAVPAGEHALKLAYHTPWLLPGAALSAVGLLLVGLLVAGSRRRRFHVQSSPPCPPRPSSSSSTPPSSV